MEISDKVGTYLAQSEEWKILPAKEEIFPLLKKKIKSKIFTAYCEFSLGVCEDIEPFLKLFPSEKPLAVFLYFELRELITSLLGKSVRSDLVESKSSPYKLIYLDLNKINLLPI